MQKILVIAEDNSQLDEISIGLKNLGLSVENRGCIVSGLEFAVSQRPDVVIVVDEFSSIGAIEFLEIRQDDPVLADIPTIVSQMSETKKEEYFKLGCDDFILSPIDVVELSYRVRSLMRRGRSNGIAGDLAHISLGDLLQMLIAARSDGVMMIEAGEKTGHLLFEAGHVVHAQWNDGAQGGKEVEGKPALLQLLRVANNGGRFTFAAEKQENNSRTISERTDHILLSLASLIDEEQASLT